MHSYAILHIANDVLQIAFGNMSLPSTVELVRCGNLTCEVANTAGRLRLCAGCKAKRYCVSEHVLAAGHNAESLLSRESVNWPTGVTIVCYACSEIAIWHLGKIKC